jgi:hypothetical protein
MHPVILKSHAVEVARICDITMLVVNGSILSPAEGVILILDDGTRKTWLVEAGMDSPEIGEFLMVDSRLKVSVVLNASQFDSLLVEGAAKS